LVAGCVRKKGVEKMAASLVEQLMGWKAESENVFFSHFAELTTKGHLRADKKQAGVTQTQDEAQSVAKQPYGLPSNRHVTSPSSTRPRLDAASLQRWSDRDSRVERSHRRTDRCWAGDQAGHTGSRLGQVRVVSYSSHLLAHQAGCVSERHLHRWHEAAVGQEVPLKQTDESFNGARVWKSGPGIETQCNFLHEYRPSRRFWRVVTLRGVTRLDSARGKKQLWRLHVRTWGFSEANSLYWRKCLWHCWDFSAPSVVIRRPGNYPPLRNAPGYTLNQSLPVTGSVELCKGTFYILFPAFLSTSSETPD